MTGTHFVSYFRICSRTGFVQDVFLLFASAFAFAFGAFAFAFALASVFAVASAVASGQLEMRCCLQWAGFRRSCAAATAQLPMLRSFQYRACAAARASFQSCAACSGKALTSVCCCKWPASKAALPAVARL